MLILMAALMGSWFFISFLAGLFVTFAGCPKWLELPWSGFGDFVETTNGRVYVDLDFYSRILCYDKSGNFVANYSWPVRNAKGTKLASGKSGLLYFLGDNSVDVYDPNWNIVFRVKEDPAKERIWKLSQDSKPILVRANVGAVPDQAVAPGGLLFSPSQKHVRERFVCHDGSILKRSGAAILKTSGDGRVLARYSSPWWFFPLKFPWPSLLSVPLCVLFVALATYMRRKSGN